MSVSTFRPIHVKSENHDYKSSLQSSSRLAEIIDLAAYKSTRSDRHRNLISHHTKYAFNLKKKTKATSTNKIENQKLGNYFYIFSLVALLICLLAFIMQSFLFSK